METRIKFKMEVAIGTVGAAILDFREWYIDTGEESLVISDSIEICGIEYWISRLPLNKPTNPGVYWLSGIGYFSEGEEEYDVELWKSSGYTPINWSDRSTRKVDTEGLERSLEIWSAGYYTMGQTDENIMRSPCKDCSANCGNCTGGLCRDNTKRGEEDRASDLREGGGETSKSTLKDWL